jgi:hypothetical protein
LPAAKAGWSGAAKLHLIDAAEATGENGHHTVPRVDDGLSTNRSWAVGPSQSVFFIAFELNQAMNASIILGRLGASISTRPSEDLVNSIGPLTRPSEGLVDSQAAATRPSEGLVGH